VFRSVTHMYDILGPTRVHNGISVGSSVFAGLKIVTNRPTGHRPYYIGNNRSHLRGTAMGPNNNNNNLMGI